MRGQRWITATEVDETARFWPDVWCRKDLSPYIETHDDATTNRETRAHVIRAFMQITADDLVAAVDVCLALWLNIPHGQDREAEAALANVIDAAITEQDRRDGKA